MRAIHCALLVSLFCASAGVLMPAFAEPGKPVVFAVSEVTMATEPLAARLASEILRQAPGDEIEACSPTGLQQWVDSPALIPHPFIAAAHLAFQEHRPLVLSPNMIWQLITQIN